MSYEAMRHFADSWGLVFMAMVFLGLVGWTFRPGSKRHNYRAANMIFDRDENDG